MSEKNSNLEKLQRLSKSKNTKKINEIQQELRKDSLKNYNRDYSVNKERYNNRNRNYTKEQLERAHNKFMGRTGEYDKLSQNEKLDIYFREAETRQLGTIKDFMKIQKQYEAISVSEASSKGRFFEDRINIRSKTGKIVHSNGDTVSFDNIKQQNKMLRSVTYYEDKKEPKAPEKPTTRSLNKNNVYDPNEDINSDREFS